MNWVIRHNNGLWYSGTQDRKPTFTGNRNLVATFADKGNAEKRCEGLPFCQVLPWK